MKANSLEELVTDSNIAGELRNYTDWHTRLVKFAQLVADWQKERMMKDAVEGEVYKFGKFSYVKERNNAELTKYLSQFNNGDKVRIVVLKEEEE